ncbi:MAG: efflux RND transporter periplasmic adaptor subunit [Vicinamibacterales bacterium]
MELQVTSYKFKTLACLAVTLVCASGCDDNAGAPKATPPAAVANPVTEANLSTITLTAEGEQRLGIATATAAVETISRTRTVGGEVVVPPGRSVTVSAPMAGTVRAQAGSAPHGGTRVERGQALFTLFPLQAGERDMRIDADRELAAATAQLQAVDHRLTRLEGLLKDGATSVRAGEEARAEQQVAAAAVKAARARVDSLRGGAVGARGEIVVRAPLSGVLQGVTAAPGQTVAAGSPLFTVSQVDALWIRVPLYVGDRDSVDPSQAVAISGLGNGSGTTIMATRVNGPPSADPATSTTDLFFAPSSGHQVLRAGERVNVQLPLRESESSLVVPAAGIVYDMQGGTWVYEAMGNHVFARRRVEVGGQSGDKVLIARGLRAGQRVVTDGAAELFGTEFGAGK